MQDSEFQLKGEFIELHKLLKFLGISESGAAAKALISAGEVRVNGGVELRKGCKIRAGYVVETASQHVTVLSAVGGRGLTPPA